MRSIMFRSLTGAIVPSRFDPGTVKPTTKDDHVEV